MYNGIKYVYYFDNAEGQTSQRKSLINLVGKKFIGR